MKQWLKTTFRYITCLSMMIGFTLFTAGLTAEPNKQALPQKSISEQQRVPTHPTRIYASEISHSLTFQGEGFYHDLWKLLKPESYDLRLIVVPHRRTGHVYKDDQTSCRFPAIRLLGYQPDSENAHDNPNHLLSEPFSRMTVRAHARPGVQPPTQPADFAGKSIVIPPDYSFPPEIADKTMKLFVVSTEQQRATVLLSRRVDLMVSSMPAAEFVFRTMQVKKTLYNPALVLNSFNLHLMCHTTTDNQALINAFNQRLAEATNSGALQMLHQQYDIDYDAYRPILPNTAPFKIPYSNEIPEVMPPRKNDVLG